MSKRFSVDRTPKGGWQPPRRDAGVYRYPHKVKTDKPDPEVRKPGGAAIRQSGSGVIVTDWDGREHKFESAGEGLLFAASLYARKPKRPKAAPDDETPARWGRHISPLPWHAERGNMFSRGPASEVRRIKPNE
jgi:hypothetical protein